MLADINLDTASALPSQFVSFRGETYFVATDDEHGRELMAFDGETIRLVKDINPGIGDANPWQLTIVGDTLFFAADDGVHGSELWKTDGTADGTALVRDISSGSGRSDLESLFAFGDKLLFQADDDIHNSELWVDGDSRLAKSDGTPAGTTTIADLDPASTEDEIDELTWLPDLRLLAFMAITEEAGDEPWVSDGTVAGTRMIADINPGAAGSRPAVGPSSTARCTSASRTPRAATTCGDTRPVAPRSG